MKFEYLIKSSKEIYNELSPEEKSKKFDLSASLTAFGILGWELINTLILPADNRNYSPLLFIFKRIVV